MTFAITERLRKIHRECRRSVSAAAQSLPFQSRIPGFRGGACRLPAPYVSPGGCLLLARKDELAVGVVGLKPLAPGIAEIKRCMSFPRRARPVSAGARRAR